MAEEKKFVCSINLRDNRRKELLAGTVFYASEMVALTFNRLKEQGYITELNLAKPVAIVVPAKKGRRVAGPVNETPDAAITPKKKTAERLSQEQEAEKDGIKKQLKKLDIKFAPNSRLDTLQVKLAAAKGGEIKPDLDTKPVETPKKTGAAMVWDADPKELEDVPFEQLIAVYKVRCADYNKPLEKFEGPDAKKRLIEKLSSEFVSKDSK